MNSLYRRVVLALFTLQLVGSVLLLAILLAIGAEAQRLIAAGAALIICAALLLTYWRGWEYARHADVIAITLLVAAGLPDEFVTRSLSLLVLLAPVVGRLNGQRAATLTSRLPGAVGSRRARLVVIDIAGVAAVDAEVARALLQSVQALRLLGCAVVVTGFSAEVAMLFARLGITLGDVATAQSPQEALELFANRSRLA